MVMLGNESRHLLVPRGVANSVTRTMFFSLAPCSFNTSRARHTVAPLSIAHKYMTLYRTKAGLQLYNKRYCHKTLQCIVLILCWRFLQCNKMTQKSYSELARNAMLSWIMNSTQRNVRSLTWIMRELFKFNCQQSHREWVWGGESSYSQCLEETWHNRPVNVEISQAQLLM